MGLEFEELKPIGEGTDKVLSFQDHYKKSLVDLSEEIKPPQILLSKGHHDYNGKKYDTGFMSEGEFSVITGPSKTKKSYLKSVLASAYIGGNITDYFPDIKTHRKIGNASILDIDTEQGKFFAQRTFRRVPLLTGSVYDNYYPFRLRYMTAPERLEFIDELLYCDMHPNPKLIFIDGVADLLQDTNDLVMSNEVANKLLKWTDELGLHICVIIHTAYGTAKPTGHLGSATTKKAETVLALNPLDDSKDVIEVKNIYSRGASLDTFYFTLDQGLPYECDELGNIISMDAGSNNAFYGSITEKNNDNNFPF